VSSPVRRRKATRHHDLAGTSSIRSQLVNLNRFPGAQEKTTHRFCAVGGEMKTLRLLAQLRQHQVEATKLDAAIAANLKELGYGA
jgi:hypothetical protein